MDVQTLDYGQQQEIADLLVGRRIVAAEKGHFGDAGNVAWRTPTGRLTLDDGTKVLVLPNQGGCACSAGDYELTHLATVDNVITSVRLAEEHPPDQDDFIEPDTCYRIYVVAD